MNLSPLWSELLNWSFVLLEIGICIVIIMHLQLSRWMPLLLAGMVIITLASIGSRAITVLSRTGQIVNEDIGILYFVNSLVALLGWGLFLAGLASVFNELDERVPYGGSNDDMTRPTFYR